MSLQPETKLLVKVHPRASKNELVGLIDGVLEVKVSAPPVEGKANEALVSLIASSLGIARSRVSVVKGHSSRTKQVTISGLAREDTLARLKNNLPPGQGTLEEGTP